MSDKMNPEVKALWITALRSGEYEQGRHSLRSADNKHCCLGVLMELAVDAGVTPEARQLGLEMAYEEEEDEFLETCVLTEPVRKWAGLANSSGRIAGRSSLMAMNDGGAPFTTIAQVIDEHL
jgi:hypothetical protein